MVISFKVIFRFNRKEISGSNRPESEIPDIFTGGEKSQDLCLRASQPVIEELHIMSFNGKPPSPALLGVSEDVTDVHANNTEKAHLLYQPLYLILPLQ